LIDVAALAEAEIPVMVDLHLGRLGYSLNAKLGCRHLAYVYRETLRCPDSVAIVARRDGILAGSASATADPELLMMRLRRGLGLRDATALVFHALRRPSLLSELRESRDLARPLLWNGEYVRATWTTLIVDRRFEGYGVAQALGRAVEDFLRGRGVRAYRLDARVDNAAVLAFHQRWGCVHVETRGRNALFVKSLLGGPPQTMAAY
jgi:ribosomal protein S18 acetylase RimI-like enzyme